MGNETGLFCEFEEWKEREKRWAKDMKMCAVENVLVASLPSSINA